MPKPEKKLDIADKVMSEIKTDKVKMKPRVYFVLGSIILGLSILLVLGLTVFLFNLTSWHWRQHSPEAFLGFGRQGIWPFLFLLPWVQIILAVSGAALGFWLIRKYSISYKFNLVVVLLAVVLVPVFMGLAVDRAGINRPLLKAKHTKFAYRNFQRNTIALVGKLVEKDGEIFIIEKFNGEKTEVILTGDIQSEAQIGDRLLVFGIEKNKGRFVASKIIVKPGKLLHSKVKGRMTEVHRRGFTK